MTERTRPSLRRAALARLARGSLLGLVLAATPFVSGCRSCNGDEVFAQAAEGQLGAVHEVGEWAAPMVPPPGTYGLRRLDEAFEALRPHLSNPNPFHRLVALEALRRLARRAPGMCATRFPELFDPLLEDPDPELRWRAAWALGRIELSRPGLYQAADDPDPRVAERALWALGQIRKPSEVVISVLLNALRRPALVERAMESLRARTGVQRTTREAWLEWAKGPRPTSQQEPPGKEAPAKQEPGKEPPAKARPAREEPPAAEEPAKGPAPN